jgi:hypothetical protein
VQSHHRPFYWPQYALTVALKPERRSIRLDPIGTIRSPHTGTTQIPKGPSSQGRPPTIAHTASCDAVAAASKPHWPDRRG